ncbi:SDR family NAD(P)-dependent oxidoreductase [Paenibacillus dokdonensis]|uniref:SDR family NAD(P)-dependent oxidoreductase n=1 Tax=Paenibacillus dokdonensis TaxID=2567944 RepID=A0ABU6GT20_9BACL|nr:SDR family NAD(P)-dependent oxidoreductase [Paenibacillus dokdonensis]MEC0242883.1 SDR family NAD(P)-dependent oxidoreductase [Paenibacillus dokdonensis]
MTPNVTFDFTGQVAVVTGGSKGIGEAAVRGFAGAGATTVIADMDEATGRRLESELRSHGKDVHYISVDVGSDEAMKNLMEQAHALKGSLDILYNNAGVAIAGEAAVTSESDWQRVLNINLGGVFRGCKYVIPYMLQQGKGTIVNCSSTQALHGFLGWAAYSASKGGILAFTRQAAIEYAKQGIRINAVAPGTIMTPMNEKIFRESEDPDQLIRTWNNAHPIGRFGQPGEIADLVMYLCSDAASFITGQTFVADGGQSVRGE